MASRYDNTNISIMVMSQVTHLLSFLRINFRPSAAFCCILIDETVLWQKKCLLSPVYARSGRSSVSGELTSMRQPYTYVCYHWCHCGSQMLAPSRIIIVIVIIDLLGSHTVSVRAFCSTRRICYLSVCLSRIRSWKLSEIGAKFHCLYRKLVSPCKNMTSYLAPEVAKYFKSSPKPQNSPKWDLDNSVSGRTYCLSPLAMQLLQSNSPILYFLL